MTLLRAVVLFQRHNVATVANITTDYSTRDPGQCPPTTFLPLNSISKHHQPASSLQRNLHTWPVQAALINRCRRKSSSLAYTRLTLVTGAYARCLRVAHHVTSSAEKVPSLEQGLHEKFARSWSKSPFDATKDDFCESAGKASHIPPSAIAERV